jgi:hypothetical protein
MATITGKIIKLKIATQIFRRNLAGAFTSSGYHLVRHLMALPVPTISVHHLEAGRVDFEIARMYD